MFNLLDTLQDIKDTREQLEEKLHRIDEAIRVLRSLGSNGHRTFTATHRASRKEHHGHHVWTQAQRSAAALRMKQRWKKGDFDSKRKAA